MKKPFPYDALTARQCSWPSCDRFIKANVAHRKTKRVSWCYKHWKRAKQFEQEQKARLRKK